MKKHLQIFLAARGWLVKSSRTKDVCDWRTLALWSPISSGTSTAGWRWSTRVRILSPRVLWLFEEDFPKNKYFPHFLLDLLSHQRLNLPSFIIGWCSWSLSGCLKLEINRILSRQNVTYALVLGSGGLVGLSTVMRSLSFLAAVLKIRRCIFGEFWKAADDEMSGNVNIRRTGSLTSRLLLTDIWIIIGISSSEPYLPWLFYFARGIFWIGEKMKNHSLKRVGCLFFSCRLHPLLHRLIIDEIV